MSGPKRADVREQLNRAMARRAACAQLIAGVEGAAVSRLTREIGRDCGEAERLAADLEDELRRLLSNLQPRDGDLAETARAVASRAAALVRDAKSMAADTHSAGERARREQARAQKALERANRQYAAAEAALAAASAHYLHEEMKKAQEATRVFQEAERDLAGSAGAQEEARSAAEAALQKSREALRATEDARDTLRSVRGEMEQRRRAEEEARRVVEEQRRNAQVALDRTRAAFSTLESLPHEKFRPGAAAALGRALDDADASFRRGDFAAVITAAPAAEGRVRDLERQVVAAREEHQRRRSRAESDLGSLEALIAEVDEALVREWADDPATLARAREAEVAARQALGAEDFDLTSRTATDARAALAAGLTTAVENRSADERRNSIGDAVMAVLQDLKFDVSYQPGSRDDPLRISGQAADERGRGDFDIAIPLHGEVDFLVDTPKGDATCVAAIKALQERLAEQGIIWQTTDWGHVETADFTPPRPPHDYLVEKVQEHQKIRARAS